MPTVCRYRPNRSHPRLFTAQDAARVLCAAYTAARDRPEELLPVERDFAATATTFELYAEQVVGIAASRCGTKGEGQRKLDLETAEARIADEENTLESLFANMNANTGLLQQLLEWFGALITFLTVLISIARIVPIPAVRLVATGAGRILTRVTFFQGAIIARKAANDASMNVMRNLIEAQKVLRKVA